MRRAAKVDANQREIIDALREAGCSVQPLHTIGQGCPDLLVAVSATRTLVMEVKDGALPPSRRRLTTKEAIWNGKWRGEYWIVLNAKEALEVLGLREQLRRKHG